MRIKSRIVAALLTLYPVVWRREYGPELADWGMVGGQLGQRLARRSRRVHP